MFARVCVGGDGGRSRIANGVLQRGVGGRLEYGRGWVAQGGQCGDSVRILGSFRKMGEGQAVEGRRHEGEWDKRQVGLPQQ